MKKNPDLSHWNYRVFRYKDDQGYGVHEAYYDKDGKVNGWTQDAIIVGDSIEDLIKTVVMIQQDIIRFSEILDYEVGTHK